MSAIDLVMDEVQSRFGLSGTKASSLLSGLLSFITSQSGGIGGFIERFRSAGLGDVLTSLFSGATRNLSTDQVESVLGSSTISNLASKAGISTTTASSAIALMLPKLIQSIAPGGAIPTKLPAELMSYLGGPTAAVAGGARVRRCMPQSGSHSVESADTCGPCWHCWRPSCWGSGYGAAAARHRWRSTRKNKCVLRRRKLRQPWPL